MNQAVLNFLPARAVTWLQSKNNSNKTHPAAKNLSLAEINKEYVIEDVVAADKEIVNFLFTLGCFKGQTVTVISLLSENYVIAIKDARYSIDADLARAVLLL
ncbi:FeoA family protein [Psychromonas sp.]|uniref:FeoA family protein n=1 Tax=Psychromonas sp. TaxID=1884585 RepID=UPI003566F762